MTPDLVSAVQARLSASGVFVVGHARTGTTVMTRALNTSPDIFVLEEANLHYSSDQDEFADWFNAMHCSFSNPPAKGCRIAPHAGNGFEVLVQLSRDYRFVGDKMAFRDESLGYSFDQSYAFQAKWFLKSAYICTLRDPIQTLASNLEMFEDASLAIYVRSYIRALIHLMDTYATFDRCLIADLGRLTPTSFRLIGQMIGADLDEAFDEYDPTSIEQRADLFQDDVEDAAVRLAVDAYRRLVELVDPETMRVSDRRRFRDLHKELWVKYVGERARALPHLVHP